MKTGRSSAGDRRKTAAKEAQSGEDMNLDRQLDYPVPPEGMDGRESDASQGMSVSREERIRARAYRLAELRGFDGGSEMDDWLAAEREVDGEGARGEESRR